VCCSVLQCVAVCCSRCPCISWWLTANTMARRLPHTATRSVKSVLQATPCNMWQHSATYYNILCTLCVAVYCCVLQCGAVWCSHYQHLSWRLPASARTRRLQNAEKELQRTCHIVRCSVLHLLSGSMVPYESKHNWNDTLIATILGEHADRRIKRFSVGVHRGS